MDAFVRSVRDGSISVFTSPLSTVSWLIAVVSLANLTSSYLELGWHGIFIIIFDNYLVVFHGFIDLILSAIGLTIPQLAKDFIVIYFVFGFAYRQRHERSHPFALTGRLAYEIIRGQEDIFWGDMKPNLLENIKHYAHNYKTLIKNTWLDAVENRAFQTIFWPVLSIRILYTKPFYADCANPDCRLGWRYAYRPQLGHRKYHSYIDDRVSFATTAVLICIGGIIILALNV
ncbi:MAG: hypothetical protein AAFV38_13190 [Pseudomonadota bacterium]